ncbi:MAG: MATE family efflux transporter [Desulfovibrio sp.]|nr:MATE family efflux transporter [Desulfovibrio sp.]
MASYFSVTEAKKIFSVGMPVFIAQLTQIGMNFVDTVMAGRYSAEALAAVAVASAIWTPITLFAVGTLLVLSAMSAQLIGARRHYSAVHLLRQGVLISMALALVLWTVLYAVSHHMAAFGLDESLARISGEYMRSLLPGIPAFLLFINLRSYLEGYSMTRPAMLISLAALALNVPCNYAFIYGRFGMPELGAAGCGVATAVCYAFMALTLGAYIRFAKNILPYRPLAVTTRITLEDAAEGKPLDWPLIGRIFRIGLPNGFAIFFECALYALSALLLAPLGATVVSGHQITMSWAGIVFAVPLSLAMTATMRVGFHLGAGKFLHAKIASYTALLIGLFFAFTIMAVTVGLSGPIVRFYNNDPGVCAIAMRLMSWCAAYQICDIVQSIASGILRGYNDTRIISAVSLIGYGVLGLPAGYALARTDLIVPAMGAAGFWAGYLLALFFASVAFLSRIAWMHRLPPAAIRRRCLTGGKKSASA